MTKMLELHFKAADPEDLKNQLVAMTNIVVGYQYNGPDALTKVPVDEPIKPVLTTEQMEENVKNAPVHEEPPQPTEGEVRDALKKLRDRKGAAAVKELLKAYGANSVPELKPENYLGARDRALAEV